MGGICALLQNMVKYWKKERESVPAPTRTLWWAKDSVQRSLLFLHVMKINNLYGDKVTWL